MDLHYLKYALGSLLSTELSSNQEMPAVESISISAAVGYYDKTQVQRLHGKFYLYVALMHTASPI